MMRNKIIILFSVVAFFASCKTAKINRAVRIVESDANATNTVGRIWEKSNPCVIDTVVQFKNGVETIKYDTLWNDPEPVIVYDTATKIKTVTDFKTIVKYVNKTDTILIDKTDVRRLNLALGDNAKLQAENDQLKSNKNDLQSNLSKWKLRFWIVIAVIAVLIGLKFYMPKIPELPKL